jgi:ABC1 atypical kinase-like domain
LCATAFAQWLKAVLGVLRGSGQEVVVKVRKPGVGTVITTDLEFLYLASKVFEFINPELTRLSLVSIIGDIRDAMLEGGDRQTRRRAGRHRWLASSAPLAGQTDPDCARGAKEVLGQSQERAQH